MPSRIITFAVFLLARACSAQFTGRTQIASLALAEQSAVGSGVECRRYYDDAVPRAIGVRIFGNYTPNTCYNLATLFSLDSYDNDTTTDFDGAVSSCDPIDVTCGNAYQANGLNFYSSSANYSQASVEIYFGNFRPSLNQFQIKVFAGEGCDDNAMEPWFSWGGCSEDEAQSYCRELPYNVRSFRLERLAPENATRCTTGTERGAGMRSATGAVTAVVGGAVIAGLLALV